MLGSGMSQHRLEWQLVARARPGIVDTSALPMDTVANPGTMNAIINFAKRPVHEQRILKWRMAGPCPVDADPAVCWCEPDKPGTVWGGTERVDAAPTTHNRRGDSVGLNNKIQN